MCHKSFDRWKQVYLLAFQTDLRYYRGYPPVLPAFEGEQCSSLSQYEFDLLADIASGFSLFRAPRCPEVNHSPGVFYLHI